MNQTHHIYCLLLSLSWYWLELSLPIIDLLSFANTKFLIESMYTYTYTCTGQRYSNFELSICNGKSWMSPWAEIFIIRKVKNWGDDSIKNLDFLWLGSIPLTTLACLNYTEATSSYKDGSALNKKYPNRRNVEHSQFINHKIEHKIGPMSI